jgi:hypothetical protein
VPGALPQRVGLIPLTHPFEGIGLFARGRPSLCGEGDPAPLTRPGQPVDLELPPGTVGAIDDHLFGHILFDDGQEGTPTTRLLVRARFASRTPRTAE